MANSESSIRRLLRTIAGAFIGATTSLVCWILLFLLATLDPSQHWKEILFATGFLLPLLCISSGVIASYPYQNRSNYLVANLVFVILATLVTSAAAMSLFTLSIRAGMVIAAPAFFVWAFIEKRYISGTINALVERLSGQSQRIA